VFPTSSTRHPLHFWPKDGKRSRPTRFECWIRTGPTCNGRHDLIRTPFETFFICLERKFHRSSNGTGLMLKSYLRRQESSKQVDVQNLSGCCVTVFWSIGLCIMSEPMGARPRVGAGPPPGPGRAPSLSYTPIASTNRLGFVSL
jgi:hypothetical protein